MRALLIFLFLAPAALAQTSAEWYQSGEHWVSERRAQLNEIPPARNVILFIGDGMSLATVSAARILQGQLRGQSGEENLLFFETFPHTALSKTYNTNQQVPDSAGTMTAMASGVKTFAGSIGVGPEARRRDCASAHGHELVTIAELAALAGYRTGMVTTTRITHATPAALVAKAPERSWESDRGVPGPARSDGCTDIARQLAEFDLGDGIHVILGGGRQPFMPDTTPDPEYPDLMGLRMDGKNLIEQWQKRYPDGRYVWNLEQFNQAEGDRLLGLFETSHMQYEHDRGNDQAGEPSLAEMTRKALEILMRGTDGFFLMVEGGRIDHAHHAGNAWRALTDALAFDDAVRLAHEMTGTDDTLIIVTADHSHAMTFAGYPQRGNPIAGLVRENDLYGQPTEEPKPAGDERPYTTLGYINGPGYRSDGRPDYENIDPAHPSFRQEASVPLDSATHAGEDVPVYATGPGSQVVAGVMEQNVIYHIMVQAVPALSEQAEQLKNDDGLPHWRTIPR